MTACKIVTAPASLPISLEEAKRHLRVEHADEDDLITVLIGAATNYAEWFTGRALIAQTWDYYLDAFPTDTFIEVPKPPLINVEGVFYQSGDTELQFESFSIDTASEPGRVYLPSGGAWPTASDVLNAARIRFSAGYITGDSPDNPNVPDALKASIKLMVGHWFVNRSAVVDGEFAELPLGAKLLLQGYRVLNGFA